MIKEILSELTRKENIPPSEVAICPYCGFDFKKIKPQLELYICECGKSQADISIYYIRVIS